MKNLGCDSTCVDTCTTSAISFVSGECDKCTCPSNVDVTRLSALRPFTQLRISERDNLDHLTSLGDAAPAAADPATPATAPAADASTKAGSNLWTIITVLVVIAILYIFCKKKPQDS